MSHAIYIPGASATDNGSQANQGEFIRFTGPATTFPVPIAVAAVDTFSFFNNGSGPVRIVVNLAAGIAPASFTGNRAALVLPGHSFQESFGRSVIGGVTIDAVTLPVASSSVDTLPADPATEVNGILKFMEN